MTTALFLAGEVYTACERAIEKSDHSSTNYRLQDLLLFAKTARDHGFDHKQGRATIQLSVDDEKLLRPYLA